MQHKWNHLYGKISVQIFTKFQFYRSQDKQFTEIKIDVWRSVNNSFQISKLTFVAS